MTPEQRAAYINAQAAMFSSEVSILNIENWERIQKNQPIKYGREAYEFLQEKYSCLHHNNLITLFHE